MVQAEKTKKMVALSLRIEEEDNRRFSALLSLNGTTASDFLRSAIKDYIKKHERMLNV
jgi:predicted DNA-binding protein